MRATTGASGKARAISAVTRSAPPKVSMKSCVMTTRGAPRATPSPPPASAGLGRGVVVAVLTLVALLDPGDDQGGRPSGEAFERGAGRPDLVAGRALGPDADEHAVGARNQAEGVGHGEHGGCVEDHRVVDVVARR